MKKLIAFIFGLLISISFYADARLVSGTAQHQHDSATGGGAAINNTSIGSNSKIAPSIYAYDSAAPTNEKYYKFGNASGDFVLFTYDDTPTVASTVFSITRTGTTPNSFDLGALNLTSSKACAANYTRLTPNYCIRNGAGQTVATITSSVVCQQTTALTGVTDAKAVRVSNQTFVGSSNAVGLRGILNNLHTGSDCLGGIVYQTGARIREEVASAAGTDLLLVTEQFDIASNTSGQFRYDGLFISGTSSSSTLKVLGYYD